MATTNFLDLPVEIRLTIYEISIRDCANAEEAIVYNWTISRPTPPSIMQTSRTTRSESLPIWYRNAQFPIKFRPVPPDEYKRPFSGTPEYSMVVDQPQSAYGMMRRLRLCFSASHGMNPGHFCYSVELKPRNDSYTIDHTPRTEEWWVGYRPWNMAAHKKAELRARRLIECFDFAIAAMIAESGGIKALTVESYKRLTPQPAWTFGEDMPADVAI